MNKISKKILAIVTMAAFVVTMMPFAAFAADRSSVQVEKKDYTVSIPAGQGQVAKATVTVDVAKVDEGHNVYVWLTDEDGDYYRYATVEAPAGAGYTVNPGENAFTGSAMLGTPSEGSFDIIFNIDEAGTYTVNAGVALDASAANVGELTTIPAKADYNTITVKAANTYVDEINITAPKVSNETANGGTIDYTGTPNGIMKTDVTAEVVSKYVSDNSTASSNGKVLTVEAPSGIEVLNADGEVTNEITVDGNNANFSLRAASGLGDGPYVVTLTADDVSYRLSVVVGEADNKAASIAVVDTGKTVTVRETSSGAKTLDDVAQFTVKNADGDILTPADAPSGFTAFGNSGKVDYIAVLDQPEEVELGAADFKVVASTKNTDNFALRAVDMSKLVPGEYTVRVSLDNGNVADVTFTVANFGKVVDMTIDAPDTVVLGEYVDGTVEYVDENGLTKKADTTVAIGMSGNAGDSIDTTTDKKAPEFRLTAKNAERYLGAVITVTAVDENRGFIATKDITVTDGITTGTIEFDSDNGTATENNTVNISVVDENGNVLKDVDKASIYAYVDKQGDEKANVTVRANGSVNDGKGKLTVYADKDTTADFVVAVKDGDKIYAATLSYTFGEKAIDADTIVAMTIGSSDIIVNNDIVSGDAAPFVDSNWRTMVPVRALSEAFGGTAEWDGDARTVTVVNGDTTIVFTADSDKYTVNGEEKTMDTELTIIDGRTYVPVKFVAEELGYKVTALKDAQGLTAGVVFQK